MIDTLEDIDPPYRSGDRDKVKREAKWPPVEAAVKRIAIRIGDHSSTDVVEVNAADLIAVMRELGQLRVQNAELVAALTEARDELRYHGFDHAADAIDVALSSLVKARGLLFVDLALAAAGHKQGSGK